jgi:hypothetical protein
MAAARSGLSALRAMSAYDRDGTVGMTDYLLLLADVADVASHAEP